MARRNRGEKVDLTKDDIGDLGSILGKDGATTVAKKWKCAICGEVYRLISADKTTWRVYKGRPVREPGDWTSDDELNHRLSHLSAKARRIAGKYVRQPKAVQKEITDLITELG